MEALLLLAALAQDPAPAPVEPDPDSLAAVRVELVEHDGDARALEVPLDGSAAAKWAAAIGALGLVGYGAARWRKRRAR